MSRGLPQITELQLLIVHPARHVAFFILHKFRVRSVTVETPISRIIISPVRDNNNYSKLCFYTDIPATAAMQCNSRGSHNARCGSPINYPVDHTIGNNIVNVSREFTIAYKKKKN
jgi:hypothetical protein